jgi:hypothetical protein
MADETAKLRDSLQKPCLMAQVCSLSLHTLKTSILLSVFINLPLLAKAEVYCLACFQGHLCSNMYHNFTFFWVELEFELGTLQLQSGRSTVGAIPLVHFSLVI